jgi:hypothetical protein
MAAGAEAQFDCLELAALKTPLFQGRTRGLGRTTLKATDHFARLNLIRAEQVAEKLGSAASGAKAFTEKEDLIAALKALRHPKAQFFSKL